MDWKDKTDAATLRFNKLLAELASCHPKIIEAYRTVPFRHQRLFLEVNVNGGQRVKAHKLKCLQCQNWQRSLVKDCTERQCALWELRPYQESK
jgi:hypothetical protein